MLTVAFASIWERYPSPLGAAILKLRTVVPRHNSLDRGDGRIAVASNSLRSQHGKMSGVAVISDRFPIGAFDSLRPLTGELCWTSDSPVVADLGQSLIARHRTLPFARSLLPQTGL